MAVELPADVGDALFKLGIGDIPKDAWRAGKIVWKRQRHQGLQT